MEAWRKQCLLAYCGYYPYEDIDNDWGERSQQATEAFQRKYELNVDGIFGDGTLNRILDVIHNREEPAQGIVIDNNTGEKKETDGTFWDEIEFFERSEFECQCGGRYCNGFPVEPQEDMVRTVNEIRRRLGVPIEIVTAGGSGVRCPVHNAKVGGVANSNHLRGEASDLHSNKSPQEMARVAEEVMGSTGEIGIYAWGIHVGVNCKYSRFYG